MNIRKIIATAAVTGAIAALPISMIAANGQAAAGVGTAKTVTVAGGQGNWPLGR